MSRPDRWWRPTTQRRPAQRARQRRMYSAEAVAEEVADGFELGYRAGQGDARKSGAVADEIEQWLREQEN